jgi:hypothetical protein
VKRALMCPSATNQAVQAARVVRPTAQVPEVLVEVPQNCPSGQEGAGVGGAGVGAGVGAPHALQMHALVLLHAFVLFAKLTYRPGS